MIKLSFPDLKTVTVTRFVHLQSKKQKDAKEPMSVTVLQYVIW